MAVEPESAAIPFVTVDDEDRFHVNPDAVAYLKTITGKIAVVSIAGVYRSGKSWLLNQLMGKNIGGFNVGNTVKATTKGIWLWGKAMQIEGSDVHVLFCDTEGLGSTVRSESYDCRIFALALLLSSFFLYNSFGTIDGNAISKLSLVVNLTRHIHVRSSVGQGKEDSGTEFNQFFPHFLWVVRDFSVKLEKDGRRISAREYLEDALRPEEGVSEAVEQKNAVRTLIRSFFPERDCVTMVRPVADEKALMNLSSLPADSLRPEFKAQIDAMRKRLLTSARPKTLYGKPLNGAMLASLAEAYVGALNAGATPTISTAWDRVVDTQCAEAVQGSLKTYEETMQQKLAAYHAGYHKEAASGAGVVVGSGAGATTTALVPSARGPSSASASASSFRYAEESCIVEEEDMVAAHTLSTAAAEKFFSDHAVQDSDKSPGYEAEMKQSLALRYAKFRRANDAASGAYGLELLDRLQTSVQAKMSAATSTNAAAAKDKPTPAAAAPGDTDASGLTSSLLSLSAVTVSSSSVAREYRAACEMVSSAFSKQARGPAKYRVLSEFLHGKLPGILIETSLAADDLRTSEMSGFKARLGELAQQLIASKGREKVAQEHLAAEKKNFEAGLQDAARKASEREEMLKGQLESKNAELDRLQGRFDKLLAAHEAANIRSDESTARLTAQLQASHQRIEELQQAKITALFDMTMLSHKLIEAEAGKADAVRLCHELRVKATEEAKSAALLLERCRAAENETVRLREQTELLYESVRVQKDLLAAKHDEKEEVEYQWGVAKAKLVALESDKSTLEGELALMTSLSASLKGHLLKQQATKSGGGTKGLTLDRAEQRAFDSLPASGT